METIVGICLIFIFIAAEKRRPIADTNKRLHLRLDIIGFVAIFMFGRLSRYTLNEIGTTLSQFATEFLTAIHQTYAYLPSFSRVVLAIIMVDFCLYWIHRFMHLKWFWRFHVWHHSVEQLYWFSGFRASFVHTFLFLTPQILLIYLLGLTRLETISAFTFGVFIQFWQHTNYNLTFGRLDRWIMTPRYHRLHHAKNQYVDKNFGTVLVIWDRMFGTYVDPATADLRVKLGLKTQPNLARMIIGV